MYKFVCGHDMTDENCQPNGYGKIRCRLCHKKHMKSGASLRKERRRKEEHGRLFSSPSTSVGSGVL